MITIEIDGKPVETKPGVTILEAALAADIYVPHLCAHHAVGSLTDVVLDEVVYQGDSEFRGERAGLTVREAEKKGCGLCKVLVEGDDLPRPACRIPVGEGMRITTTGEDLVRARQVALNGILADHPHACLLCEQREGCSRTECSMNVPVKDRCCVLLGHCEIGKVSDFVGYADDLPTYSGPDQKTILTDPLFVRDYELCIGCLKCVRVCRDVVKADVLGAVMHGDQFIVGTKKPGDLPEAECRFCGACVEICPTGALRDREGVETPAGGQPLPCIHACPAGIDIPLYVRRIAEGDLPGARRAIAESVPLPATLGYVCFHPCEDHCRRGRLDDPVAICDLKRFAFDTEEPYPAIEGMLDSGRRVAIVGAGPAGLSAAWLLALKGHKVTLFDAADKPGGFLRQVLPRFRLPEMELARDLEFLDRLGIEFHGGRRLGRDLDPRTLREFGYDAVLLAMGTPLSKQIDVPGAELDGVLWGVDYLRAARSDRPVKTNGRVVVIGGGGVAMDTAMTALRSGVESVEVVSLEQEHELPAHPEEVAEALAEGVSFTHGWGPHEFRGEDGRVGEVVFARCNRVFDEQGRFDPQIAVDARITREADWVILAVGLETDTTVFGPEAGDVLKNRGLLSPDAESVETWLPGFFGAGDLVHGPSSVVEAIASGKRAAAGIDRFLGGDGRFEFAAADGNGFDGASITLEPRQPTPKRDPKQRMEDFELVRLTMDPVQATAEANRCLRCNIRHRIGSPVLPPEEWVPLEPGILESAPDEPGVCVLADVTGKPEKISGTASIRWLIDEWLEDHGAETGHKLKWVLDPMYTKRESEIIQQHIQRHGELPGGGDDELDDLF
ncbi:MAG: NADPH-Fe(3+) oxidoreductase subunit beta [Calditrichaeota bacterium]|nr:NADPH-Fe(3+) oxidoreductase subunit beta [Calditrichota bacterium]